jgi:hypothetical protein
MSMSQPSNNSNMPSPTIPGNKSSQNSPATSTSKPIMSTTQLIPTENKTTMQKPNNQSKNSPEPNNHIINSPSINNGGSPNNNPINNLNKPNTTNSTHDKKMQIKYPQCPHLQKKISLKISPIMPTVMEWHQTQLQMK